MFVFSALFGGASPTLANLAGYLTSSYGDLAMPGLGYWFGVLLYAAIGAVVAAILSDRTHKDALKLGIIAPALILSFANASVSESTSVFTSAHVSVFSEAQAQEPSKGLQAESGASRTVTVSVARDGWSGPLGPQMKLEYVAADSGIVLLDVKSGEAVEIPDTVQTLEVQYGAASTNVTLPPSDAELSVQLQPNRSFRSQFLWALTGKPNIGGPEINAKARPNE